MKRVKKSSNRNQQEAGPKSGRKQASPKGKQPPNAAEQGSGSDYVQSPPKMRFDATIYAPQKAAPDWVDKLNIDRVPDPKGLVRALVTEADCVRLLNQGFEVHLHQAHPVRPIDPKLIETDESFKRWLDKEVKKIKKK